jgi:protein-disulfide isomerase
MRCPPDVIAYTWRSQEVSVRIESFKRLGDVAFTLVAAAAASLLLWNQFESRRDNQRARVQEVSGLSIDATAIRHSRGNGNVAFVEFTDYECPFCAMHAKGAASALDNQLVAAGRVKHVVFNYPLDAIHLRATKAAEAAECAGRQGRFWEMHQWLFTSLAALSDQGIRDGIGHMMLKPDVFSRCLAGEAADVVKRDRSDGARLGVTSTPTFFVGLVRADGGIDLRRRLIGALPFDVIRTAIDDVAKLAG